MFCVTIFSKALLSITGKYQYSKIVFLIVSILLAFSGMHSRYLVGIRNFNTLPFGMDVALCVMPFVGCGYLLQDIFEKLKRQCHAP